MNDERTPDAQKNEGQTTPKAAIRRAWLIWMLAVAVCAAAAGTAMGLSASGAERDNEPSTGILIFGATMFAILIPLSFLAHWYCFRRYWKDGVVQPYGYLLASVLLWGGITLTVVINSIVSIIQGVFMPSILLVLVALLILLLTWPSGWGMVALRSYEEADDEEALHLPREPNE